MTGLQALEAIKNGCPVRRSEWTPGEYAKVTQARGSGLGIYRFASPKMEEAAKNEFMSNLRVKSEDFLFDDWEPCACTFKDIYKYAEAGGDIKRSDWPEGKILRARQIRIYNEHRVGIKSNVLCHREDNNWKTPVSTEELMAWLSSDELAWIAL